MRLYTNEATGEGILLNPKDVWYHDDIVRLQGHRNTTIYMHYRAWKRRSLVFQEQCAIRKINVVVVY